MTTKTAEEWCKKYPGLDHFEHAVNKIITTTRADERQKALTKAAKLCLRQTTYGGENMKSISHNEGCRCCSEAILALRDAKGKE